MAEQKRIMLWTVPRSASASFYRAMMNRLDIKGFNEAYFGPYYLGPEKVSERFTTVNPEFTFQSVTSSLEEDYPEYKTIFAKEAAYVPVRAFKEKAFENLPKGFTHTLMIRNPKLTVASLYKITMASGEGWETFDPTEVGFKESFELASQIKAATGQNPIVFDASDLVENPEGMMRAYCKAVGMEFQDAMIHWTDDPEKTLGSEDWCRLWFKQAMAAKTFTKSVQAEQEEDSSMPEIVRQTIEENMPYYDKLKEFCLSPI